MVSTFYSENTFYSMLFWLLFSQYIINVTKYSTKKRTTNEVDDETQKKVKIELKKTATFEKKTIT